RVQLRGQSGQVVATDARQLLVQGGFPFPWQDSPLVPRLPLLDIPGLTLTGPAALARVDKTVILRIGAWAFWLGSDADARFPPVEDAIPRDTPSCRLRLDPADAAFL